MEELQKLMTEFEKRNNISIYLNVYTSEISLHEFWYGETLYDGPASGLTDFLKNTRYKLGKDGKCFSPVQKLKP